MASTDDVSIMIHFNQQQEPQQTLEIEYEDSDHSEYSDDDDVPPLTFRGRKKWDYFRIAKADLAEGLDKLPNIYKVERENLFHRFQRNDIKLTFAPTRKYGFYHPEQKNLYIKVKGKYLRFGKRGKHVKVELMNIQDIENARKELIGFCKKPKPIKMRYKAAKVLKKRLQHNGH